MKNKLQLGSLALMNDPELFTEDCKSPCCLVVEFGETIKDDYQFVGSSEEEIEFLKTNYPKGIKWVRVACMHVEDSTIVDFWILETELTVIS